MMNKKIYRYTNVELLDLIKSSQNKSLIQSATTEFEKRNLTKEEKQQIELDYLKFKEFQKKRAKEPLTENEWISFFILPFFTPKPKWREDHYSESELERFKNYGFNKKLEQAKKVRSYGYAFWFFLILATLLLLKYFKF